MMPEIAPIGIGTETDNLNEALGNRIRRLLFRVQIACQDALRLRNLIVRDARDFHRHGWHIGLCGSTFDYCHDDVPMTDKPTFGVKIHDDQPVTHRGHPPKR